MQGKYYPRWQRSAVLISVLWVLSACQTQLKMTSKDASKQQSLPTVSGLIAYLGYTKGYWQVFTMKPDGTHQKQVTYSNYDKSRVSWYSGQTTLLVNANLGQLYIVDLIRQKEIPFKTKLTGMTDAVLSPNKKHIVFSLSTADSVDANNLWIMGKDGSDLKKVTHMKWLQHEPAWGPKSEWIYFLSGKGGQTHDIWRISLKEKNIEQLTIGSLYHFDVAVSVNKTLAYSSNRSGQYEIWTQAKGGKAQAITHSLALDARPSWSPDGQMIAYESAHEGVINIWLMTAEGDEARQLTNNTIGARFPVWSPVN